MGCFTLCGINMKKIMIRFFAVAVASVITGLNASENNEIKFILSIVNDTPKKLNVQVMREQTTQIEANNQAGEKNGKVLPKEVVSLLLNKGGRVSVSIKDEQMGTLLLLSAGRGVYDLRDEAVERLLDYKDPLYNVFVRTTDNKHELLSAWRLKEDKRAVYPCQVKLLLEFYLEKHSQVPQVRQSLHATSLPILQDRVKAHVEPIKDSFFK